MNDAIQGLNPEQRRAVECLDRNILLLATAGTGKTNTLSLRIAHLVAGHFADPEQILCLTFTNRACKEMKERVEAIAKTPLITVKTFHSFCFDLVQLYARQQRTGADLVIYDEADCAELLGEIDLTAMRSSNLYAVQRFIDHIKEQAILFPHDKTGEVIRRCWQTDRKKLESICSTKGVCNTAQLQFLLRYGAGLIRRYNTLLAERHALDFNDILSRAQAALSDQTFAMQIADRYRYIHIDEVQDTSLLEYNIIQRIFGRSVVMLCGDYFQTIYQWRGSKPRDIFSSFLEQYRPLQLVFHQNYRSTKRLLQASYGFLKAAFPGQVKDLYGEELQLEADTLGEKIQIKPAQNIEQEAAFIYGRLQQMSEQQRAHAAILCRSNQHSRRLSQQMIRLNLQQENWIEFLLTDQYQFFRSKEVKDVLAFLRLLVNPYDDTSLARVLMGYARGVGIRTIQYFERGELRELGLRLNDFIHPSTLQAGEPYRLLHQNLQHRQVVVFDVESTGTDTAKDEIIQIAGVRVGADGEVADSFEQLLKPTKPVGDSVQVHGLTDQHLAQYGMDPGKALREFCLFAQGSVLVGHNVGYDLSILQSQLHRLGLPALEFPCSYDTLDMARRFLPGLENYKLETLSAMLQTETQSSHDAMDDILATKGVLIWLVEHKISPTSKEREKIYSKYSKRFQKLAECLEHLRQAMPTFSLAQLIEEVITQAHMEQIYPDPERQGHLHELVTLAKEMQDSALSPMDQLQQLLETAALSANQLDRMLAARPRVPIITVHQAKGAEFDTVFLAGLQDDQFPSYLSQKENHLEEEKRTFYVALTRAKRQLICSFCLSLDGRTKKPSRFLSDLPSETVEWL